MDNKNIILTNNYQNKNKNLVSENTSNDVSKKSGKNFTGKCRLFVGNLPNDISETEFKEIFSKYGEIGEAFLNTSRSFGFIKLVIYVIKLNYLFKYHIVYLRTLATMLNLLNEN